VAEEDPPRLILAGVVLQRKLQTELLVEAVGVLRVPDQEVSRIAGLRLDSEGFERDLRADARDVTKGNSKPAFHKWNGA